MLLLQTALWMNSCLSPSVRCKQRINDARLVVVTSQEIDSLCEGENVSLARQVMIRFLNGFSVGAAFCATSELSRSSWWPNTGSFSGRRSAAT